MQKDLINGVDYRHVYDIADRQGQTTGSKGNSVSYIYDDSNNKNKISDNVTGMNHEVSYGFDKDNWTTSISWGIAINHQYTEL